MVGGTLDELSERSPENALDAIGEAVLSFVLATREER
jgi:hypothetical protein